MKLNALFSTSSDDYETPQELYDSLNSVFRFTLDPCSRYPIEAQKRISAAIHYTPDDDGLSKEWGNNSTFINPPYSKSKLWIKKAMDEFDKRRVYNKPEPIVLLIPARTDTKAMHELLAHPYAKVIFLKGRIKFDKTKKTNAPFPSCIVILSQSSIMDKLYNVGNMKMVSSWIMEI